MNIISDSNNLCKGQIGPIKSIGDGVYTAEGISFAGEKMFFAMESIENNDMKKWNYYKNSASTLVWGGYCDTTFGSLSEIGSRINDEIGLMQFLNARTVSSYWTSNQSHFENLKSNLKKRTVTADSSKGKELSAIPHASNGMNVNKQTHVVYVSKTPVASRVNFESKSKGFGGYVEKYGNLIMSVGVTVNEVVENRGIFRNPLSVVEGGFGGISMMTHSFTCMAVEDNWPEVDTFRVRPLKKMGELFLSALPKEQVTVNGIRGDLYDKGFEKEQNVEVPLKVLSSLYRAR